MPFLRGSASYWKLIEKTKNMLTHWLELVSGVRESTLCLYLTQIFIAQMGEPKEGTDILGQWFIVLLFPPSRFSFQFTLKFWYKIL